MLERILARKIYGPACLQRVFDEDKFLRRPERPWSRPASRASAPLLLFRRCTPTVGPTGLQATRKSRPETAREDLRALNGCSERRIRCWMIQVQGDRSLSEWYKRSGGNTRLRPAHQNMGCITSSLSGVHSVSQCHLRNGSHSASQ